MPLYDFCCRSCGERFEARVSVGELPACPACAAPGAERQFSGFSGPFTVGKRGAEARRSDALRRGREERRLERRARRQEESKQQGDPAKPRKPPQP